MHDIAVAGRGSSSYPITVTDNNGDCVRLRSGIFDTAGAHL